MLKFLKSPEKLFTIAMWLVSWFFASFLIGMGASIIADLPKMDEIHQVEDYANQATLNRARADASKFHEQQKALTRQRVEASAEVTRRTSAHTSALQAHKTWLSTRTATASNPLAAEQDLELLRRNAELDALVSDLRKSQVTLETIDEAIRVAANGEADAEQLVARTIGAAQPAFQTAQRVQELKVFGARLAFTLPLLVLAVWLVMKKRKSTHWPLARGFVLFAIFAFFFELVPYLPSYGGYIRQLVGILLCIFGGHYGIRWMQGYLERRRAAEQRNERERRATIDGVVAIQKMAAHLCPGCDRQIPTLADGAKVNHCVYCGLKLFDLCRSELQDSVDVEGSLAKPVICGTRKNAFFAHCPSCGSRSESASQPPSTPDTPRTASA